MYIYIFKTKQNIEKNEEERSCESLNNTTNYNAYLFVVIIVVGVGVIAIPYV